MIITTAEGWRIEIHAFVDPEPRIYITTDAINRPEFTGCVVNGVPYYATAHLTQDASGAWAITKHTSLHMSRAQWRGKVDDWTWPARRKLERKMVEIATGWAAKNPTEFNDARLAHRNEQIEKRQARIEQLKAEIETLSVELKTLEQEQLT